jgi:hypothetical protein
MYSTTVRRGASDSADLLRRRQRKQSTIAVDLGSPERVVRGSDAPPLALVFLRGAPVSPASPGDMLDALLRHADLQLTGRITVVKGQQVRQRPFPPARNRQVAADRTAREIRARLRSFSAVLHFRTNHTIEQSEQCLVRFPTVILAALSSLTGGTHAQNVAPLRTAAAT